MTKDEVLKLALDALGDLGMKHYESTGAVLYKETFTAIKKALAQPEREPVATLWQHGETGRTRITMPDDITDCDARWFKAADLYTTPPQRTWVGLTPDELNAIFDGMKTWSSFQITDVYFAIEAKLKEKNT
jgi:hypothetical protein